MEKIFCKLLPMFIMLTMFQIVIQQYSKRGGGVQKTVKLKIMYFLFNITIDTRVFYHNIIYIMIFFFYHNFLNFVLKMKKH